MPDQPHAHRAVRAQGLEHRQCFRVAVDGVLQFGAGVADRCRVDEDGRDAGVDQRRLERADAGHVQVVDQVAGGEHRAAAVAVFLGGGVKEFELDFGGREGHAVELEVAGLLHRAVGDGHMRDDGLADVGLPDAHGGDAVVRDAAGIDEAVADGERTHGGGKVAAVAGPVHKRLVDRDLAEQVVDVVVRACAFRQDDRLAGARRGAAHAVDLLAVRVGAADHAQQQRVARGAGHLRGLGQVLQAEEHALAGAAAHVGGGNPDLGRVRHAASLADSRKSCAKRCSTPPAS